MDTRETVHRDILVDAAKRAEDMARRVFGRPIAFYEHNNLSGPDTLTLTYDTAIFNEFPEAQHDELEFGLMQIGIEAIKQAIAANGERFAGLIVGYAKIGKSYFDE